MKRRFYTLLVLLVSLSAGVVFGAPKTVIKIASRKCYTGKAEYNANGRVPNPEKPLVPSNTYNFG